MHQKQWYHLHLSEFQQNKYHKISKICIIRKFSVKRIIFKMSDNNGELVSRSKDRLSNEKETWLGFIHPIEIMS